MKLNQAKLKRMKLDKEFFKDLLKGSLFSLIITLVMVLILGIVIKFVDIPSNILMPVNQIIKVLSLLIGAIIGFKKKESGAIKGGFVGLVYTLLSLFIFLILGGNLADCFSFIDLIMGVVIGAISGIIAVNTGKRHY